MILIDFDLKQTLSFAVVVFVQKTIMANNRATGRRWVVSDKSIVGTKVNPDKFPEVAEKFIGIILSSEIPVYTFSRQTIPKLLLEVMSYDNYLKLSDETRKTLKKELKKIYSKVKSVEDEFLNGQSFELPFKERLEKATLFLTHDPQQAEKVRTLVEKS